jgi:hypothetical protein
MDRKPKQSAYRAEPLAPALLELPRAGLFPGLAAFPSGWANVGNDCAPALGVHEGVSAGASASDPLRDCDHHPR